MRLIVAAVGRLKQGPERDLAQRYRERIAKAGRAVGFQEIELVEIAESRAREPDRRKTEESIALAQLVPEGAVAVLLDERGEDRGSAGFADTLRRWRDEGRSAAGFVIGGAPGGCPKICPGGNFFPALRPPPPARPLVGDQRPEHA